MKPRTMDDFNFDDSVCVDIDVIFHFNIIISW